MTVRKLTLTLFITLLVILAATLLRAQTSQEAQEPTNAQAESYGLHNRWRELQAQRLEGSWDVIVTPAVPPGVPQPPSFHAYSTFARGGAFIGSDRNRAASKQHGVWQHLGGNRFTFTLKEDLFDALGNFAGIATVRARLTLTGRDEYVGVANGEQRDANGNLLFNRCSTFKGTRIKLEPLAEQCQNIQLPQ
jgi:glucose/arabinose dehydrogenase